MIVFLVGKIRKILINYWVHKIIQTPSHILQSILLLLKFYINETPYFVYLISGSMQDYCIGGGDYSSVCNIQF